MQNDLFRGIKTLYTSISELKSLKILENKLTYNVQQL